MHYVPHLGQLRPYVRFGAINLVAALLVACGGGGGGDTPTTAQTPAEPVAMVEMAPTTAAPNDNLQAATSTPASTAANSLCGYAVGTSRIVGTVSSVHDGDTLTINGNNVRLDSIDAPELAQTYGAQSQKALSSLVLGKSVTVAYNKKDKYGRIVGAVFTDTCQYVNLSQVATGSAWFYRAYQCEISAAMRSAFAAAEDAAKAADLGLWAGAATPPWVFRNGVDASVPSCSSDSPVWEGNPSTGSSTPAPVVTTPVATAPVTTTIFPTTPTTTPTPGSCYMVWVNAYTKANGTRVAGYWRRSPGCA